MNEQRVVNAKVVGNKGNIWNKILLAIVLVCVGAAGMYAVMKLNPGTTVVNKLEKEVTVNENGIADAVEKVYNSVVVVENYRSNKLQATGTGFIFKKDGNKYYTNNLENIEIHKKNSDDLVSDVEVISLGYNLFKRFGLEDIELSINCNEEVLNLLEALEIYCINDIESNELTWNYIYEDVIVGVGCKNNNEINIKINIETLINEVINIIRDNALDMNIDVCIIGVSEEESYHALKIAQELRMNNINVVLNEKVNSKFNINLDDETLSKGIVSIKDNYTNEEIKLDEADILEYVLGNI